MRTSPKLALVSCLLLAASNVGALRPSAPAAKPQPRLRPRGRVHLVAETPTKVGSVAAGIYTGLAQFLNCAAVSTIVFAPASLPLAIGIQHSLLGFAVSQAVVTRLSGLRVMLAVPSFEALPFLASFALIVSRTAGITAASALATVLVGSLLFNLLAGVLLVLAAEAPVENVDKLLPPALQAGLFAAIGWSLYLLAYETLGLSFSPAALATRAAAKLWVPANVLGLALWGASRTPALATPALFPGFIVGVTAAVHAVRIATGASLDAARDAGWLMAEAVGEPCTALWRSFSFDLVRWDVLMSGAAAKQLVCAALFGPLLNTVLNLVLLGPMTKQSVDLKRELRAHAAGCGASSLAGGYNNYVSLSDTAVHRSVGGFDPFSCYVAAATGALFLIAYPLSGLVGYVPTLVIAAICVYIGAEFLWSNLVEAGRENGPASALAAVGVLALCLKTDMLNGALIGVVGFQLARWWQRRSTGSA